MKLLLLFILSTVVTASRMKTGCTRNSTYMDRNNETVDILCHSFPIIHQYVNKLLQSNVSIERTATMSNKSYRFVQYLMELNNGNISSNKQISECQFNDTGNVTVRNSLTPVKECNMSLSLLDILIKYAKNLKTRYALLILQDELGVTRKQFMKQLVDIKAEVQVDHCKNYRKIVRLIQKYKSIILNCNLENTTTILLTFKTGVVVESYSWLIVCENCMLIEQLIQNKNLEVIADVVLLQLSDYMEVSFTYTHSARFNNSIEVKQFPKTQMCHMTRLQKTCEYTPLQHTNYLLHNNKDIETIIGFSAAQTLYGCKFTCLIYSEMDFAVPFRIPFEEIIHILDISPSIVFTYYSGNVRRPSTQIHAKNSLKSYLSPFTGKVWVWISLVTIANVLAWAVVRRFRHRKQALPSNAQNIAISFWNSLFDTWSVLQNQGVTEAMPVTSYKIILATISLFTVLYLTCYSTVLVTYLSDRRIVFPFTSLDGFADDPDYHFIAQSSLLIHNCQLQPIASKAQSGVYKKIHLTKECHYQTHSALSNGNWLLVSEKEFGEFLSASSRSDLPENSDIPDNEVAIKNIIRLERNLVFQKGFPHQAIFFRIARKLVEAGLYQKLHAHEMNGLRLKKEKKDEMENVIPVEINAVVFLVAICLIGWTMSLIAFTIELLIVRRRK